MGVVRNKVWKLKQTSEEILYQVYGQKGDQLIPVKTEPPLQNITCTAWTQKGKYAEVF